MWREVAKAFLAFAFGEKQRPKHWPRCALSEKMETTHVVGLERIHYQ
jgi:hypothetical protein